MADEKHDDVLPGGEHADDKQPDEEVPSDGEGPQVTKSGVTGKKVFGRQRNIKQESPDDDNVEEPLALENKRRGRPPAQKK